MFLIITDINKIVNYCTQLSYGGRAALNLYWNLCKNYPLTIDELSEHLNGSREYRIEKKLFDIFPEYHYNAVNETKKIVVQLCRLGMVKVKYSDSWIRVEGKYSLKDHYQVIPCATGLFFQITAITKQIRYLKTLTKVHDFLRSLIPKYIPTDQRNGYQKYRNIVKKKLSSLRYNVHIQFPLTQTPCKSRP